VSVIDNPHNSRTSELAAGTQPKTAKAMPKLHRNCLVFLRYLVSKILTASATGPALAGPTLTPCKALEFNVMKDGFPPPSV
jgi:hypothetical protein